MQQITKKCGGGKKLDCSWVLINNKHPLDKISSNYFSNSYWKAEKSKDCSE